MEIIKGDVVLIRSKEQLQKEDPYKWPGIHSLMLNRASKLAVVIDTGVDSPCGLCFLINRSKDDDQNSWIWVPRYIHPFVIRNYRLLLYGTKN